jgi:hypothetical protein
MKDVLIFVFRNLKYYTVIKNTTQLPTFIYFNLHFNVYHECIADVIWERWAPEDEP